MNDHVNRGRGDFSQRMKSGPPGGRTTAAAGPGNQRADGRVVGPLRPVGGRGPGPPGPTRRGGRGALPSGRVSLPIRNLGPVLCRAGGLDAKNSRSGRGIKKILAGPGSPLGRDRRSGGLSRGDPDGENGLPGPVGCIGSGDFGGPANPEAGSGRTVGGGE